MRNVGGRSRFGRTGALVHGLLLIAVAALLVSLSPVAQGHDRAPDQPGPDAPGAGAPAPGEAVPAGMRVVRELPSLRTALTRTYELADGRRLTKAFLAPVNYRDAKGDWKAIDSTLERTASGDLGAKAVGYGLELPARVGGADPVRIEDGGEFVEFSLDGAQEASATVKGPTATYGGVGDGVDLEYRAVGDGLKELIVLKDRAAAARHVFTLRLSDGLKPREAKNGAIEVVNGDRVQFTIPAPYMRDAGGETSREVRYSLRREGSAYKLEVAAAQLRPHARALDPAGPTRPARRPAEREQVCVRSGQSHQRHRSDWDDRPSTV